MAVTNDSPPVITGTATQGRTLVASTGAWTSDDPLSFDYQWERCDSGGASCVDIAGAVNNSYFVLPADVSHTLRVEVTATETSNPTPPPPDFFGVPINASGLGNLEIGKVNRQPGHRFTALFTGTMTGVNVWLKQAAGYSAGDGGDIRCDLYASSGGFPTGSSLANYTVPNPTTSQFWTFPLSHALVAGTTYCLVWSNTSSGQATNYVSLNNALQPAGMSPRQPFQSDAEQGVIFRIGAGSWQLHDEYTPIHTIFYADGSRQGNGYSDYRSSSGLLSISGNTKARMLITPTATQTLSDFYVWIKKSGSPSNLAVTIKHGVTTDYSFTITAASISSSYGWAHSAQAITLSSGVTYSVELSASTGTYNVFPYQSGESNGFSGGMLFSQGYYQFSTDGGSNWQNFSGSTAFDIPLYFT